MKAGDTVAETTGNKRGLRPFWSRSMVGLLILGLLLSVWSATVGAQTGPTVITGEVSYTDRTLAGGVVVDIFGGSADGNRSTWLGDLTTDDVGQFALDTADFTNPDECWIITVIAPTDDVFDATGSRWSNHTVCLRPNIEPDPIRAELRGGPTTAALNGLVLRGDSPVPGVVVDLFQATGDGSRGAWLGDTETGADGGFLFSTGPGCYFATVIAPESETFVDSGNMWLNLGACLADSSPVFLPPAVLNQRSSNAVLVVSVIDGGEPAADVAADLFTGPDLDTVRVGGTYIGTERTGADGEIRFEVEPGCYRVVVIAPDGRGFQRFAAPRYARPVVRCVEAGEIYNSQQLELIDPQHGVSVNIERGGLPVSDALVEIYTSDRNGTRIEQIWSVRTEQSNLVGLILNQGAEPVPECWVVQAKIDQDAVFIDTGTDRAESLICREEFVESSGGRRNTTVEFPVAGEPVPLAVGSEPVLIEGVVTGLPELFDIDADPGSTVVLAAVPGRNQGLDVNARFGSDWRRYLQASAPFGDVWGRIEVPSDGEVILGTSLGLSTQIGDPFAFTVWVQPPPVAQIVDVRDGSDPTITTSITLRGEAVRYEILARPDTEILIDQRSIDSGHCDLLTQSLTASDGEYIRIVGGGLVLPRRGCLPLQAYIVPDDGVIVLEIVGDDAASIDFLISGTI